MISGTIDPITRPRWGAEAARHLPNAKHLIVPGAHGRRGSPCVVEIMRRFLDRASAAGLDTSCVESLGLQPLVLPRRRGRLY